ncbi:hypothetical protein QFC19_004991 [Naganishia cerealis]|uniref:Uncharacterized protein n=1 Tax=Naganishia cerealis TaxID=610337 RepID=A0ACC2VSM9_9TREE|nr:hypothetical protein QFC19_004991 [Naganishia cerealis]
MSQSSRNTPSRNVIAQQPQPQTPLSALSQAFPPDIHSTTEDLTLDLSAAGTPVNAAMTPGRPMFDPNSPFVAKRMDTPCDMFLPASVDNRMRAKLFGQGLDGGFLVSPMTAGLNSTVKKHIPRSSLKEHVPLAGPRIYNEDNEDPFSEESMQSLGWNHQPLSTPVTEGHATLFGPGVGLGVGLTEVDGINASGAASPITISTPSKYPSSLGTGVAPLLRNRSRMIHPPPPLPSSAKQQQYEIDQQEQQQSQSVYLNTTAAPAMQHSLSASATLQQHVQSPAQPTGVQCCPQGYASASDPAVAKVKAPLTLSQVPKRQRSNRTAMSRSLSMNNAVESAPSSSAFTHQPLNRMPSRKLSSSSLTTASVSENANQTHQLFPVGAGKTIYTGRNVSNTSAVSASSQLSTAPPVSNSNIYQDGRNASTYNLSTQSMLNTPALDYSLASPAFSVYGQSPWLTTPAIGSDPSSSATSTFQFQQDSYAPFATGSGLAIQMPYGALPLVGPDSWQDGQAVSRFSDHRQASMGNSQEIRVVTPMSHGFDLSSQYPVAPPVIYTPQMGISYMAYPAQASGYWLMSSGSNTDSQGPLPMAPNAIQENARHVSAPYPNGDTAIKQEPQHDPMTRSISHGYVPVIHHPSYLQTFGMGPLAVISGPALPTVPSLCGGSQVKDSQPQSLTKGMVNTMTAIGEEVESGSPGDSKPRRVKYPAVGKRLRPGPRPKQRRREDSGTVDINQVAAEDRKSIPPTCKVEAKTSVPSAMGNVSTSPLKQSQETVTMRHHPYEAVTSLSKEFLESCYSPFMMMDEDSDSAPSKRYRCNIDNCGRIFPRKSAIHSHVQTHLEDKPFVCTEPEW